MVNPASALEGYVVPGQFGQLGAEGPAITLQEISGAYLTQLSFFKAQKPKINGFLHEELGCLLPDAGQMQYGKNGRKGVAVFRGDPSKAMVISSAPLQDVDPKFYPLDLSDARTFIYVSGSASADLLARLAAVDVRQSHFQDGDILTTGIHHIAVQIWRHKGDFILILPRSFAASLYQLITEIAGQFGYEVKPATNWTL